MISSSIGCCEKTEEARIYLQKTQGTSTIQHLLISLISLEFQNHTDHITLTLFDHWTLDIGHYLTLLNRIWRIAGDEVWPQSCTFRLRAVSDHGVEAGMFESIRFISHRLAYPIALLKFPFHVWCFLICCFCIRAHLICDICVCRHEMTADVRPVQNNGPRHHYRAGGRESAESAESARCKREIGGTCFGRRWI